MSDLEMDDNYDFGYNEEEEEEEPDVDLENQYYNSKALKESDPQSAIEGFETVLSLESEKGEWGFRALTQMVKINYKLDNHRKMIDKYRLLLTYTKSAVTRNFSEKVIISILDLISTCKNLSLQQEIYHLTLDVLKETKNERLWFKTNLKLGKLYYDLGEYSSLGKILRQLHTSCQKPDGTADLSKGTQLLEIYALEIQMYTAQKDNKKLKALYERSLQIKAAIPHPLIMGIIRECGGKMHMSEGEWEDAHLDFFEAFKNYDECGNTRRLQCLKYLVLANMLMGSDINPFDAQEAKSYKNDTQILAMTNLLNAYQQNNLMEFEKILRDNRDAIMGDSFIRNYIEDLMKKIRTQVLQVMIKPYTRIRIPFISKELNIPEREVEQLLVSLVLDKKINGTIDQINQLLVLTETAHQERKYSALSSWAGQLRNLNSACSNKLH